MRPALFSLKLRPAPTTANKSSVCDLVLPHFVKIMLRLAEGLPKGSKALVIG
jgi:hypothetical protein